MCTTYTGELQNSFSSLYKCTVMFYGRTISFNGQYNTDNERQDNVSKAYSIIGTKLNVPTTS